jgi:cytochrome c
MVKQMSPKAHISVLAGAVAVVVVLTSSVPAFAQDAGTLKVDAVAAQRLARKSSCLRCHALSKKKEGPSYQSIAYKYKGNSDAPDKLFKHITTGEDEVKLTDGHVEVHKDILGKASPESIKNLVAWILSQ